MNFRIILLVFSFSISFFLTGCFDKREIDEQTYVIGIGLDKGNKEDMKLTIQYAIPTSIVGGGGGSSEGGGEEEQAKSLGHSTVECKTIYSGINILNSFIGKGINMSHTKILVISEELAKSNSLDKFINSIHRGREFRPDITMAVSRGSAEAFLKSIKPNQEINPAKFYELKIENYQRNGFYVYSKLSDFFRKYDILGNSNIATMVGVNSNENSKNFEGGEIYEAGRINRVGDIKGETMGIAIFKDLKYVGELNGNESRLFLMGIGDYGYSIMTFNDLYKPNNFISLSVSQSREPKIKIDTSTENPKIEMNISLEADLLTIQSGENYELKGQRELLEKSIEKDIKNDLLKLLNKSIKEYECDFFQFSNKAKYNFRDNSSFYEYNWFKKFKNTSVEVNVSLKIRRPGLMIRTIKNG